MKNLFAYQRLTVLVLALSAVIMALPSDGFSIPAFARKYSMSCNTCHAPAPKLKAYGDGFAGNGFVLKDKDAPRYTVETGDDRLSLIRDFPIAARLDGFVKHQTETGKELDVTFPYNLKLLSGGALAKNISYYFYFFFSERGEVAGIEDAYVMFNNLFGSELDAYVGQFQVSDPLFKREVRLTYEDYQVYRYKGDSSAIGLTYDRGLMLTYGFPSGTDLILEVLNGNGIGEADEYRTYDNDKYKCVAARASQDIGEQLRLGAFAYYGQEGDCERKNEVRMGGFDGTATAGPLELNVQYMQRDDTNPELLTSDLADDKVSDGLMAELIYMPGGERSTWYAVGLYNWVDRKDTDPLYHSATIHLGYLIRTNIRAFVENTYHIEDEENRFVLGLMTGF